MVSTKANNHASFISPARIQQGCPGVSDFSVLVLFLHHHVVVMS